MALDLEAAAKLVARIHSLYTLYDEAPTSEERNRIHGLVGQLADMYLAGTQDECAAIRRMLAFPDAAVVKAIQTRQKSPGLLTRILFLIWPRRGPKAHIPSHILLDYATWAARQFQADGHVDWLRRSLAAISIEDLHFDFRDSYVLMGALLSIANQYQMDSQPHFEFIADRSNEAHLYLKGWSVSRSIRSFRESACAREANAAEYRNSIRFDYLSRGQNP